MKDTRCQRVEGSKRWRGCAYQVHQYAWVATSYQHMYQGHSACLLGAERQGRRPSLDEAPCMLYWRTLGLGCRDTPCQPYRAACRTPYPRQLATNLALRWHPWVVRPCSGRLPATAFHVQRVTCCVIIVVRLPYNVPYTADLGHDRVRQDPRHAGQGARRAAGRGVRREVAAGGRRQVPSER